MSKHTEPFSGIVIALDLEMNQPSRSIIEIGAVAGNIATGQLLGRFNTRVRLPDGEELDPRIQALCDISPESLTEAPSLPNAFNDLLAWLDRYPDRWLNPVVWGHGDVDCLASQLETPVMPYFGRREMDVKTIYCAWRIAQGSRPEGGLARAMTHLGLHFDGRKHRAVDDAYNTFRIWAALQKQFKVLT